MHRGVPCIVMLFASGSLWFRPALRLPSPLRCVSLQPGRSYDFSRLRCDETAHRASHHQPGNLQVARPVGIWRRARRKPRTPLIPGLASGPVRRGWDAEEGLPDGNLPHRRLAPGGSVIAFDAFPDRHSASLRTVPMKASSANRRVRQGRRSGHPSANACSISGLLAAIPEGADSAHSKSAAACSPPSHCDQKGFVYSVYRCTFQQSDALR